MAKHIIACVGCGHTQEAGCDCGVHYIPLRPGLRAKAAIAAAPEKSNRVIADELGVDEGTVRRARGTKAANAAKCAKSKPTTGEVFHAQLQGIMDDARKGGNQEWTSFILFWNSCSARTRARIKRYVEGDIYA